MTYCPQLQASSIHELGNTLHVPRYRQPHTLCNYCTDATQITDSLCSVFGVAILRRGGGGGLAQFLGQLSVNLSIVSLQVALYTSSDEG